ncbi:MAG: hypothetical protein QW257_03575 [Candidatus Micrarchaeaceae archaeon]
MTKCGTMVLTHACSIVTCLKYSFCGASRKEETVGRLESGAI